jgi:hypothetical protein
MFTALRKLSRAVALALYPGEEHLPREWSSRNQAHVNRILLDFLDRHLRRSGGQVPASAHAVSAKPAARQGARWSERP